MDQKRILIVDDEFDIVSVMERRLTVENYEVITARNGNDAITFARLYSPDLIIVDVGLADMHGGEVIGKIRENESLKDVPCIVISALYSKADQIEKKGLFGAEALFAKPYEIGQVLETVDRILHTEKEAVTNL